ncbi:hypothetical protein ABCR94_00480 [Streptomyces sp. 21So2-11]|uniref:hypothetical protein n=1 Tax=Streptomyces sp. 21So2-11 TaxID=3144408 RepID=UPI003219068A
MTILRRHLSTGYTVLPTATLEDSRLSFRARGILGYLIAKPDSWKVRTESIAKAGKEGRDAVREAVKELKVLGYYRVVTERLDNGQLVKVTEVYDTVQEWAGQEYLDQEARRITRRLGRELERDSPAAAEDGFSGVGSPVIGAPGTGGSGDIGSNQSQHPEKENPPTPTADAAGEPAAAGEDKPLGDTPPASGCSTHPDGAGPSCRGCGTSPRQQREAEQRAQKERFKKAEREANERVLKSVRRTPGGQGLSAVARQSIDAMRDVRVRSADDGSERNLDTR